MFRIFTHTCIEKRETILNKYLNEYFKHLINLTNQAIKLFRIYSLLNVTAFLQAYVVRSWELIIMIHRLDYTHKIRNILWWMITFYAFDFKFSFDLSITKYIKSQMNDDKNGWELVNGNQKLVWVQVSNFLKAVVCIKLINQVRGEKQCKWMRSKFRQPVNLYSGKQTNKQNQSYTSKIK